MTSSPEQGLLPQRPTVLLRTQQQEQQQDEVHLLGATTAVSFEEDAVSATAVVLRSLDQVLEEARAVASGSITTTTACSSSSSTGCCLWKMKKRNVAWNEWRYWRIFVCLGICNSSDATEILCLSYILANQDFVMNILQSSPSRASLIASVVFAGMLLGGLFVASSSFSIGYNNNTHAANTTTSAATVAHDDDDGGGRGRRRAGGRRRALLQGLATNAVAGTLSAIPLVSSDRHSITCWSLLCAGRFVSGIGIGYSIPPLFTLCTELAPARDRGFWGAFVASFWMMGSLFVAIVAWLLLEGDCLLLVLQKTTNPNCWRVVLFVCTIPSALGYVLVQCWVPESPRYLALQGHYQEAVDVVRDLTTNVLRASPLHCQPWTLREAIHQYSSWSGSGPPLSTTTATTSSLSVHSSSSSSPTALQQNAGESREWIQVGQGQQQATTVGVVHNFWISMRLLYKKPLQRITWPLQGVWFALSFGSYGLLIWINTLFEQVNLQNIYFNALIFALSNLPGNLLSTMLLDTAGRTIVLVTSLMAAALSLLAFAYIANVMDDHDNDHDGNDHNSSSLPKSLIVISACSFQCCTVIAWNTIAVMTPELYPTTVRNSGVALCGASGRLGALVAQIINGFTVHSPVRMLSIAAATLLFGAMSPALLPPDKTRQTIDDQLADDDDDKNTNNNRDHQYHDNLTDTTTTPMTLCSDDDDNNITNNNNALDTVVNPQGYQHLPQSL